MKMKRKLALLTSVVMLLGSLNVTAFAENSGDVNGDNEITKEDADLIMQYVLDPASLTEEQRTVIAAEGDTAQDCDDADYTASDGTVIEPHAITAKDAALLLQQSLIDTVYVYVTAGKVGSNKAFKPLDYSGETLEEAQAAAKTELADMTISDYFYKYETKLDDVNTARIDQVNDFLNKVYINDWALSSYNGRAWIEAYLNVNSETDAFFDTVYDCVDSEGNFAITVDDVTKIFEALKAVEITEEDQAEINNRINGAGGTFGELGLTVPDDYFYTVDHNIPALWLRTTFQVGIYDVVDGSTKDVDVEAMKDYRNSGYSVAEWYYYNRATEPGTTEQYFIENFLHVVNNYAVKAINLVHNDAKMEDLVNLFGGDRLELTINKSNLPSVAKNPGNYDTLEEFEAALGDFSDPTNTYYLDFSQLGYDF